MTKLGFIGERNQSIMFVRVSLNDLKSFKKFIHLMISSWIVKKGYSLRLAERVVTFCGFRIVKTHRVFEL